MLGDLARKYGPFKTGSIYYINASKTIDQIVLVHLNDLFVFKIKILWHHESMSLLKPSGHNSILKLGITFLKSTNKQQNF